MAFEAFAWRGCSALLCSAQRRRREADSRRTSQCWIRIGVEVAVAVAVAVEVVDGNRGDQREMGLNSFGSRFGNGSPAAYAVSTISGLQ